MALGTKGLTQALQTFALGTGAFGAVNGSEPDTPATDDAVTASVWFQSARPAARSSGLAATSFVAVLVLRAYRLRSKTVGVEAQDEIDTPLTSAVDLFMERLFADLTLGGTVRVVDVRGAEGTALTCEAGYAQQDQAVYRIMTVTIPVVINDLYAETQ